MQRLLLIRKITLAIVNVLLLLIISIGVVAQATSIGSIIEHKGSSSIEREEGDVIAVSAAFIPEVQANDTAETADGRMLIQFLDEAKLSLTENTRVYIDKVYYDPNPAKSKMVMRMAVGTARFASGRLGMVNKNNIDIQTPTATISVRGTDFTTTIDELGRSLIVLLPDENGMPSGEIDVMNLGGTVTLNEAYATTMVSSMDTAPTRSVIINNITANIIDNMFIVSPPPEVKEQMEDDLNRELDADQGLLDVDFLEFDGLDQDYLQNDELAFSELDIDMLNVDFLVDLLDVVEELIRTTDNLEDKQDSGGGAISLKGAAVGFNTDSQYNIFAQDGNVVFYRNVNGQISLTMDSGANATITTFADGYAGTILLNGGEDVVIVITQKQ
tara:strand:+ start:813 stop:1970 length:1158 start_codon:yes stop_codon:yes gene_type:complete